MRDICQNCGMSTQTREARWVPDTAQFGARLALVRWQMGWNLKEASLACGFAQNSWGGWESGQKPRDYLDTVDKIVKVTGVSRMWLMMGEGNPSDYKSMVADLAKERRKRRPASLTRPRGRSDETGPRAA